MCYTPSAIVQLQSPSRFANVVAATTSPDMPVPSSGAQDGTVVQLCKGLACAGNSAMLYCRQKAGQIWCTTCAHTLHKLAGPKGTLKHSNLHSVRNRTQTTSKCKVPGQGSMKSCAPPHTKEQAYYSTVTERRETHSSFVQAKTSHAKHRL